MKATEKRAEDRQEGAGRDIPVPSSPFQHFLLAHLDRVENVSRRTAAELDIAAIDKTAFVSPFTCVAYQDTHRDHSCLMRDVVVRPGKREVLCGSSRHGSC